MTNTYLLEVIKALQPAERQEMTLFLDSPHFNRGSNAKELKRLYQFILNAAPEFSAVLLQKDAVYFQVFLEPNIVHGKLEKLMADLNKLLRVYVLTKRQLSDNQAEQQQIDWAIWLRERGLVDRAQQTVAKLKNHGKRVDVEDLDHYRTQLSIAQEEHEWESILNQVKGDLKIPEVVFQLDLFYYNYRTELENRYLLQQKGAQLPDFELTNYDVDLYKSKSLLLQISKNINEILRSELPSIEDFKSLMDLLQIHERKLSFQTLSQYYAYLRSACTLLINNGYLEFTPILHQIHKANLAQGLFFIHGEMSPHPYINLVQIAIRAKDLDWAIAFTEQYQNKIIGGDEGRFFYRFNLAHCLFAQGDFNAALSQIPDAFTNSHYHHIIRRLEIKIYYELRSELFVYKLDAFRKFVERTAPKTIAANLRKMDLNFFNILNQLSRVTKKGKAVAERLVERIEHKRLVSDRAWLIEKAKELE